MESTLTRRWLTDRSTIGVLTSGMSGVGGNWYVLEDKVREIPGKPVQDWKVKGETAIPYGRYRVVISPSNGYRKLMPELLFVQGFTGIRIHAGNTDADTEGCLLLGTSRGPDRVNDSRTAFNQFFEHLKTILFREQYFLTIRQEKA